MKTTKQHLEYDSIVSNTATAGGNYYDEWDFYTYYEPEYHWINFKRNTESHWHENAHDVQIHYFPTATSEEGNETTLIPGRGYLVAFADSATYLQCKGELTTGDVDIDVTASGYYSTGHNLLGNPYQSYLDFNAFAKTNAGVLWDTVTEASYSIIDERQKTYAPYAYGSSDNPFGAGRYIHPHQGFMVRTQSEDEVRFDTAMRLAELPDGASSTYRESRVNYPLVNLFVTDAAGNRDMATVELGRPDRGGARLIEGLRMSKGQIWCRYDAADWSIAFTRPGITEVPVRFKSYEDTEYTLTWSTHNGEFSYLHLVDNMTGADVDCLAEGEYKFTSKADDYTSRFRLVFEYTGIDEGEAPEPVEGPAPFAFRMGDEWVVNGAGTLQLFDVNGRQLMSTQAEGTQTTVRLPEVSAGVYVLRLGNGEGSKVQKIVIR